MTYTQVNTVHFNKGNFVPFFFIRIASPFLDVLEEILSADDSSEEEAEEGEMVPSDREEENRENVAKCLSECDFSESDEGEPQDGDEQNEREDADGLSEDDIE